MLKKTFSNLPATRLTNNEAFSLIKSTIDFATPVQDNIGEIARTALHVLTSSESLLAASINKSQKSIFTKQLMEINADRKNRYAEIKRTVTYAIKGRDATKRTASKSFKIFLIPFWNMTSEAINTQTSNFSNLFDKYDVTPSLIEQAKMLGIAEFIDELRTVNSNFDTLYKARNSEQAAKQGPSGSDMKPQAVAAYSCFCTSVELAVNFNGNDVLVTLFNNMDGLRKKYALLIHVSKNTATAPVANTEIPTATK